MKKKKRPGTGKSGPLGPRRGAGGKRGAARAARPAEAPLRLDKSCAVFLNLLPTGVWIMDTEGNLLKANLRARQMTGYSLAQLKRVGPGDAYYDPAVHPKVLNALRRSGKVRDFEALFRRRNKKLYWVLLNADRVEINGRKAVLITLKDVTQAKFHRQHVEFTSDIIQTMGAGLVILRRSDGIITYANRQLEKMFGYRYQEMHTKPGAIMCAPKPDKSRQEVYEEIVRVAHLKGSWSGEIEHVRKDGSRFWAQAAATTLVSPWDHQVSVWVLTDITKRREAEDALRASERNHRMLFNNVPVGVYRTTPNGRILMANPALIRMLGYSSYDELTARNLERDGFEPDYPRSWFKEMVDRDGGVRGLESVWRTREGARMYVRESAVAIPDKDGRVRYYEGIVEDITQQKRADEELHKAHAKLIQAREEERRHLAAELHDSVGQGLISLQLLVKTILAGERDVDADKLKRSNEVAERCAGLVEEVRNVGHGLYPPTLESLGLAPSLRDLVSVCGNAGIVAEVRCETKASRERFPSDVEIAVFRIAQEAVSNVLRHSRAGHMDVELGYTDGFIMLSVVDDGIGFEPAAVVGKGLGLNSMRERARAIGGELQITSENGRTCVKVRIPTRHRGP